MLMRDHCGMWIHYGMPGRKDSVIISEVIFGKCYRLDLIRRDVKIVVDVGAHIGSFAAEAHREWPDASIICIEPIDDNIECLTENCGGFADIRKQALHPGSYATMWIPNNPENTWSSTLEQRPDCTCSVVPSFWPSQIKGVIDVLKLDCEGAEYEVMNERSLENVRVVVGEFHDKDLWSSTVKQMRSWDFNVLSENGKLLLFHATNKCLA